MTTGEEVALAMSLSKPQGDVFTDIQRAVMMFEELQKQTPRRPDAGSK